MGEKFKKMGFVVNKSDLETSFLEACKDPDFKKQDLFLNPVYKDKFSVNIY